jgi:hypothetical protein
MSDIKHKNIPVTVFSEVYFLLPYLINKKENKVPNKNVNNDTL